MNCPFPRLFVYHRVAVMMLISCQLAAHASAAEDPFQVASEQSYALGARDAAVLDRAYDRLVRTTLDRLRIAKEKKLSPENPAVEELALRPEERDAPEYHYDSVCLTVAAGLESRAYDRGAKELWKTVPLPWPVDSTQGRCYTKDVPAHVRLGSPSNQRLFILLNSSYSTWERGSWINKCIALLRKDFGDPHFVVFGGFLTPEFLALQSAVPALGAELPASDLHVRLRSLLASLKTTGEIPQETEVCLAGFSGGANLVISLLAQDGKTKSSRAGGPLFPRGGVAFSPILDAPASFGILDRSCELLTRRGFPAEQALTSPFKDNTLFAALRGFNPFEATPYLQITRASTENEPKRQELAAHFYREFEVVDLPTTMTAAYSGMERLKRGSPPYSHLSYYKNIVFPEHRKHLKLDASVDFDRYLRIEPELKAVDAPLCLVFALDDPVLARSGLIPGEAVAERCLEVLAFARSLSPLRVFAPEHGAHLGYILDNSFVEEVFKTQFRELK
jgi:hypothetical protein